MLKTLQKNTNYKIKNSDVIDDIFEDLAKKDKEQLRRVYNKLKKIAIDPYHFDPLRGDLHGARKARIGSYRLIFEIDDQNMIIWLLDYGHRKDIYCR
jgi:mRNA interferase RelE/StbE